MFLLCVLLGQNSAQEGAKIVFICCKSCAHRVFFFKIVFVAGAKRGGLEVDVCVEELIWSGEVVWHGVILEWRIRIFFPDQKAIKTLGS